MVLFLLGTYFTAPFFIALEVGILRMPANERRSREIGAYTRDLLSEY